IRSAISMATEMARTSVQNVFVSIIVALPELIGGHRVFRASPEVLDDLYLFVKVDCDLDLLPSVLDCRLLNGNQRDHRSIRIDIDELALATPLTLDHNFHDAASWAALRCLS